jgi:hypothetical protein
MSQQIPTAYVKQFHGDVEMIVQQEGSVLSECVRNESQNSEIQFYEQMGPTQATRFTDRHGDSPQVNSQHLRRAVTLESYDWGDFIDKVDKVQILIDPTNPYAQAAGWALGRERDLIILEGIYGSALTGKEGSTSVTFAAEVTPATTREVAVDFGGTAVGLTIAKLIEARRLLKRNKVMLKRESLYCALTSQQEADLLNTTEVTSADYNSVKALVRGDVDTFLNYTFVQTELLADENAALFLSSTHQRVPVWVKSGVLQATAIEIQTDVVRRWDKRGSWYVYAMGMSGAVRMQGHKVVSILCDIP